MGDYDFSSSNDEALEKSSSDSEQEYKPLEVIDEHDDEEEKF